MLTESAQPLFEGGYSVLRNVSSDLTQTGSYPSTKQRGSRRNPLDMRTRFHLLPLVSVEPVWVWSEDTFGARCIISHTWAQSLVPSTGLHKKVGHWLREITACLLLYTGSPFSLHLTSSLIRAKTKTCAIYAAHIMNSPKKAVKY